MPLKKTNGLSSRNLYKSGCIHRVVICHNVNASSVYVKVFLALDTFRAFAFADAADSDVTSVDGDVSVNLHSFRRLLFAFFILSVCAAGVDYQTSAVNDKRAVGLHSLASCGAVVCIEISSGEMNLIVAMQAILCS